MAATVTSVRTTSAFEQRDLLPAEKQPQWYQTSDGDYRGRDPMQHKTVAWGYRDQELQIVRLPYFPRSCHDLSRMYGNVETVWRHACNAKHAGSPRGGQPYSLAQYIYSTRFEIITSSMISPRGETDCLRSLDSWPSITAQTGVAPVQPRRLRRCRGRTAIRWCWAPR
jgi:hypothetical protein